MSKELKYSKLIGIILLVVDAFLIDWSWELASYVEVDPVFIKSARYMNLLMLFKLTWVVSWLTIVSFISSSLINILINRREILKSVVYAFGFHLLLLSAYAISFPALSWNSLAILYGISGTVVLLIRLIFRTVLRQFVRIRRKNRKAVIVGANHAGQELHQYLVSHKSLGYQFLGFFDDEPELSYLPLQGTLADVKAFCVERKVDEIYYALPLDQADLIKDLTDFADDSFISFKIAPDLRSLLKRKVNIDFYGDVPVMKFRKDPLQIFLNQLLKRGFDIAFSLLVLSVLVPLVFPIIALLIRLESKGPIFFEQPRSGRKNKPFLCYKFRSMYVNAEANAQSATRGDRRITRVGAFLRKTSLDELPQFINVLLGQMSVVGPRPHMEAHTREYSQSVDKYLVRHFVTPGITGYAQVNGSRGEISNADMMKKRVEYDTWYMENWSLWLDLRIILRTVTNAIRGEENAY
ncbi:putative colanic acid biosysnthesis UDP-glucose lipid carrier transferase [Catalinimonas alkaloidigena]|uniref:Putative colanic acid biosysnthesis UDP-glucose lipid carrier transferase n=1 Tax=Catalinimonas alkaloidigena TaxID=1075417 RepID=A0A1G9J413_9BACT|nr:undecaprenyl-phosphate glucose phosphotransferase [Catalinimonas alkaloidigena]SDL32179.1 putative colanic acid biosysnthesis UDP-glucose lipid carrier transferase [Catalinimonas alkaloidigena]